MYVSDRQDHRGLELRSQRERDHKVCHDQPAWLPPTTSSPTKQWMPFSVFRPSFYSSRRGRERETLHQAVISTAFRQRSHLDYLPSLTIIPLFLWAHKVPIKTFLPSTHQYFIFTFVFVHWAEFTCIHGHPCSHASDGHFP